MERSCQLSVPGDAVATGGLREMLDKSVGMIVDAFAVVHGVLS